MILKLLQGNLHIAELGGGGDKIVDWSRLTLTAESVSACKAFYCWPRNHKEATGVRGEFMNCFENPTIQTKRLVHCKLGQEWNICHYLT